LIKKINAIEWKKEPLDYETSKITFLLEAAESNTRHGDRLGPKDKKQIARDIATSDPECTWTEEALSEKLGVIQQTVNTWISDIRARQRAARNFASLPLAHVPLRFSVSQGCYLLIYGRRSSRQGCNPAGESPAVSVARVGYVVMPHLGAGNQPSYAWCKRPGRSEDFEFQRWVQPGGLASVGA
jgi:hypothetical protein